MQTSKAQNVKVVPGAGSTPECEETVAESVADENSPFGSTEKKDEVSKNKSKDVKGVKAGQSSLEEKKVAKPQDDKRSRPKKIMEFHNIKISQVFSSFVPFDEVLLVVVLSFILKSCRFQATHIYFIAGGIVYYV